MKIEVRSAASFRPLFVIILKIYASGFRVEFIGYLQFNSTSVVGFTIYHAALYGLSDNFILLHYQYGKCNYCSSQ
jgi:hypothetical protein